MGQLATPGSGLVGLGGSAMLNFSGDPKFRTLHNVKSPAIQSRLTGLLGDYDATRTGGQDALTKYIADYLAGQGAAETRTGEEMAPINRLYGGGVEADLAALRSGRTEAVNRAAKLGADYGIAAANRSSLGGDGSGGSYRDRLLMAATQPYYAQAAVDEANAARQDYGDVMGQQVALAGRRQAMQDALVARGLAPQAAEQAMYSQNLSNLGGLVGLENANNMYGLQQKTTGLQRWGNFLNQQQGQMDSNQANAMQSY